MGVFTIKDQNHLMLVIPGVPGGNRVVGCRYLCCLHLMIIPKPNIHQLLRSVEVKTEQLRYDLYGTLTGGAEFRPAKRGCQLRQPHNLCVVLDSLVVLLSREALCL